MNDSSPTQLIRLSTAAAASMLLWISRTLLGLLVSYPILLAIRASSMASGPEGDAVLFQPGSLLLLELLRLGAPWLASATRLALFLAGLSAILELIPLAMALDMLWLPGRPLLERVARALRLFPRFLALGAIALLAQAALLLAASLLTLALKPALSSADERLQNLAPIALFGLGLLACTWFGCVLDIARATLVRRGLHDSQDVHERGARSALAHALLCLRERPFSVLIGAYPSVAGSALGYLSAAWLLTRLDLAGPSSVPIALAFGAHQLAVLFAIAWRVRWLGTALELSRGDN
ncbi:MAG: hypothetical protein WDO74_18390 [Pseudomonadota bacterium]